MPRALLEICIASVDDAVAAFQGGADRLELNTALPLGGLTPSLGLLCETIRNVSLPVIAMVRPRPGGFCYSEHEFETMRRDACALFAGGASGLAFGVLRANGEIDVERCRKMLEHCHNDQVVFHRAFDVVPNPHEALEALIELGFTRVMTSGQETTAYNGRDLIAELIRQANGRIEVLPAGGINRFNVRDVIERTGCNQVHCSLRHTVPDPSVLARPHVTFGGPTRSTEDLYDTTSESAVRKMVDLLGNSPNC